MVASVELIVRVSDLIATCLSNLLFARFNFQVPVKSGEVAFCANAEPTLERSVSRREIQLLRTSQEIAFNSIWIPCTVLELIAVEKSMVSKRRPIRSIPTYKYETNATIPTTEASTTNFQLILMVFIRGEWHIPVYRYFPPWASRRRR